MRFYLSGGMEFKSNHGKDWREWITEELSKLNHSVADPVKLEVVEENGEPVQILLNQMKKEGKVEELRHKTRHSIFYKDMLAIQQSNAFILLYDVSVQRGAGSLSETWEAFREGRPIYVISALPLADVPTWLIAESTQLFFGFEEFLNYIQAPGNIELDIVVAEKEAAEVLGGVYIGD
jgi:hypothetical protein